MTEEVWDSVGFLRELAKTIGCTACQLAIASPAQQPENTSVIIGPRTMDHLQDNLGSLNVELTEEDCQGINEKSPPGSSLLRRGIPG